jgi:hypothetical protein
MIASEKDELEQTVNSHLINGGVAPILSFQRCLLRVGLDPIAPFLPGTTVKIPCVVKP